MIEIHIHLTKLWAKMALKIPIIIGILIGILRAILAHNLVKCIYISIKQSLLDNYHYITYSLEYIPYNYMGIRLLAIIQPFYGQSGWNFLWELMRLLSIDYIVMGNHDFDAFLKTVGPPGEFLGQPLSQKVVSRH